MIIRIVSTIITSPRVEANDLHRDNGLVAQVTPAEPQPIETTSTNSISSRISSGKFLQVVGILDLEAMH
jgi:hypothetical protein